MCKFNVNDIMENNEIYEVETDLEIFSETLEALENKYSVAKFSSLEWKPLSSIEISNEEDAKKSFDFVRKVRRDR